MVDKLSKQQRSMAMSAVKSRGNKSTEIAFIQLMKKNKIKGWRRGQHHIEGKPDFIFSEAKIAVFVDGCFWHGCKKCFVLPKSNIEFWRTKIGKNIERDKLITRTLKRNGWLVLRIWEHDIKRNSIRNAINKIDRRMATI